MVFDDNGGNTVQLQADLLSGASLYQYDRLQKRGKLQTSCRKRSAVDKPANRGKNARIYKYNDTAAKNHGHISKHCKHQQKSEQIWNSATKVSVIATEGSLTE